MKKKMVSKDYLELAVTSIMGGKEIALEAIRTKKELEDFFKYLKSYFDVQNFCEINELYSPTINDYFISRMVKLLENLNLLSFMECATRYNFSKGDRDSKVDLVDKLLKIAKNEYSVDNFKDKMKDKLAEANNKLPNVKIEVIDLYSLEKPKDKFLTIPLTPPVKEEKKEPDSASDSDPTVLSNNLTGKGTKVNEETSKDLNLFKVLEDIGKLTEWVLALQANYNVISTQLTQMSDPNFWLNIVSTASPKNLSREVKKESSCEVDKYKELLMQNVKDKQDVIELLNSEKKQLEADKAQLQIKNFELEKLILDLERKNMIEKSLFINDILKYMIDKSVTPFMNKTEDDDLSELVSSVFKR